MSHQKSCRNLMESIRRLDCDGQAVDLVSVCLVSRWWLNSAMQQFLEKIVESFLSALHVSVLHPYSSNGLLITLNYPSSPVHHDMEPATARTRRGSRQSWVGDYSFMFFSFMRSSSMPAPSPDGLLNRENVYGFLSGREQDTRTHCLHKSLSAVEP